MKAAHTVLLAFVALAALPAAAGAATARVDFETGPALGTPVGDDYLVAASVTFPRDPGFRPYRRQVGAARAHSGNVVVDVGADVCAPEGGTGNDCEFVTGGTTGRLTQTASAVTLFAGSFGPLDRPQTARLTAHRTDGTTVRGATMAIGSAGFTTAVTVASPAADIDSFTLESTSGDLGFDDLTLTFPGGAAADITASAPSATAVLLQGHTTGVPVQIGRLNGSFGPVRVTATGLPRGVSATASPNPVGGGRGATTLRLAVSPTAPDSRFELTRVTVTADPLGNPAVAPATRSTTVDVRVAPAFGLSVAPDASSTVALPDCAPVDVPLVLGRDFAFAQGGDPVTLSLDGLPSDIGAELVGDPVVASDGGLNAQRSVRLTRIIGAVVPATVVVRASAPGYPDRTLALTLGEAPATATLLTPRALTPRALQPGTEVRIAGAGFCPGTRVAVGTREEQLATLIDSHTLAVRVGRLAVSGPVTVLPPRNATGIDAGRIEITNVRNTDGFAFPNFPYGGLSLPEVTDAFGADDLFVKVNPCWPFGDCEIQTGFLNPVAALDWGVLNLALRATNGHCFGFARAVQQLTSGRKSLRTFSTGRSVFSIPSASGPQAGVSSYLDGQHAVQGSAEFLAAWLDRDQSLTGQLARIRAGLAQGELPILSVRSDGSGHTVNAYDIRETPDGADVDVYDNAVPFIAEEESNALAHVQRANLSVLHVDTTHGTWRLKGRQGERDDLFVTDRNTIPDDPSLPGVSLIGQALEYVVFGSADGAVQTTGSTGGADYLPALDEHALPRSGGWWLRHRSSAPLTVSLEGRRAGRYTQAYVDGGLVASVTGVATRPGVRDRVTGDDGTLRFAGGLDRPLHVELARPARDGVSRSASLVTSASAGGADAASLTVDGALRYAHRGAPTTASFTLGSLRHDGGPVRFASGPIAVGRGDRIVATPLSGDRARLVVTHHDRTTTVRVLRSRAPKLATLRLGQARVTAGRLFVTAHVAKLRGPALLGVSLRVLRGHRVVARLARSLPTTAGSRTLALRLPARLTGRLRVRADARLLATAGSAAAVTAHRAGTVIAHLLRTSPTARRKATP